MAVKPLKNLAEFNQAIDSPNLSVFDFYATWCGPCKAIAPTIEKFSEQYTDVAFYKIDIDQASELAAEYNITSMPTFVFGKDGGKLKSVVGANVDKIKEAVEEFR
uniref:Thioredoxin n=1 Tax=Blastobotrys adeninivorans TaxID=409370 RepID=A0A060T4G9_BLAAD